MTYPLFHPRSSDPHPLTLTRSEFETAFPAEDPFVERKSGAGRGPLQDAVVSFSNTDGGVILIGVADDGRILGKELTSGLLDDLHEMLRTVHDPGRYGIESVDVDGQSVVVLWVAKREEGFSQTSQGRVLIRQGTHKVPLFGSELREFINSRTLQRFEATSTDVPLSAASGDLIDDLAKAYAWSEDTDRDERMVEVGLVARESGLLTVAGALYLIDDPGAALGKTYIEILRFPEGATEYDRRVEIVGPLPMQVEEAAQFVAGELGNELVVLGLHRYELPRLPLVVLREAISNAVAHRSYEMNGTAVRIELRPDAVTITSPGGLPEPVTVENLRDTQAARNLDVIRVLRRMGLAEDAGRGIDVIEDSMRQEMLEPPRFTDDGHAVTVTLPIRSPVAPAERAWVREIESRGLTEPEDRVVLVHAARGETLTNARVRELLGVDQLRARQVLQRLRDAGFLEQHGSRGGASYGLKDSLAPPAGLRLGRAELQDVVVELAREGPVSNARVRMRTGLERTEALSLLEDLVASGRLVRIGQRRGTRYILPNDNGATPTDAA